MSSVFISYSHTDGGTADMIASILEELGIRYFRDVKDIEWGHAITQKVREGLESALAVIVIVSPGSAKSHWVSYEIGYATALRKRVLPYLTHPAIDPPGFMADLSYAKDPEQIRGFFSEEPELEAYILPGAPGSGTSAQADFRVVAETMPALLADMKDDLSEPGNELVREFVPLRTSRVQFNHTKRRFEYHEDAYDELLNSIDILWDYGFVEVVDVGSTWKIYRMTRKFVELLGSWEKPR